MDTLSPRPLTTDAFLGMVDNSSKAASWDFGMGVIFQLTDGDTGEQTLILHDAFSGGYVILE